MKYGKYNDLVEEVILFSKNPQINERQSVFDRIIIINDFQKAEYLAYEGVFSGDGYNCKYIRELEMSEVWSKYYTIPEDERPKGLEEILEIISDNVRGNAFNSFFFNEVVADLNNCAINRAINGRSSSFFEDLFEVYQIGAIPCGWEGDYPEGRIVAYKIKE
ncbi:hypothetical protein K6959_02825 [Bacillus aquiflavi]|uniref:hypothetical protein n=1 Tax=Bacillus aquiflavi TaxID=2672567 RepID=UPI001CA7F76D|nr:hypothetical protein [Bacillus aquiflavi]UAC48872.1 hypothetical protein K6959_02825 [Bacillus aquiflavi]